jgi:hypothetical protein
MPRSEILRDLPRNPRVSAVAAMLLVVTAGCGGASEPATTEVDENTENYEGRVLTCPRAGGAAAGQDLYAVDHMTRKLQDFPALAAHAGLSAVTSCEEALGYVKAYREFSATRPNFERVLPKATTTAAPRPPMRRLKVANAGRFFESDFPRSPNPIVYIEHGEWGKDGMNIPINEYCDRVDACTGNIIAKNWILTAAHCLQPSHRKSVDTTAAGTCPAGGGMNLPTIPNARPFEGDAYWVIRWTANERPFGSTVPEPAFSYVPITIRARQLPHPNYVGLFNPITMDLHNNFDIALLYLPSASQVERFLPPDVDSGGAALISAANLQPPSSDRFHMTAGYGLPDPAVLRAGPAPVTSQSFNGASVETTLGLTWNGTAPCPGDSGGPLFRVDEKVFGTAFSMVITGVMSGVMHGNSFLTSGCPSQGDRLFWSRIETGDSVLGWINTEMRRYNGSQFECRREKATDTYYKCWGEPCRDDLGCPQGKICKGAGSSFPPDSCDPAICGGGCSCIVGQCVPAPKRNGGTP